MEGARRARPLATDAAPRPRSPDTSGFLLTRRSREMSERCWPGALRPVGGGREVRGGRGRNGGKGVLRRVGEVWGSQSKALRPEGWMGLVAVNGSATCYHRGHSPDI